MIRLTFPRELRLLTPQDFNCVFQNSIRAGSPYITLVVRKNHFSFPRLGFAIAKKQVKRAHERNRIKRIAREYFRHNQDKLSGIDFILMARHAVIELDNQKLTAILDKLCQQIIVQKIK